MELRCGDVDPTDAQLDWRVWHFLVLRGDQHLFHPVHLDVLPWYVRPISHPKTD